MAITATIYDHAYLSLGLGRFDFTSQPLKLALCTSAYTPNYLDHEFYSDLTGQVVASGYTAGGNSLSGVTWTVVAGRSVLTASPVTWGSATFTCRYAVLYRADPAPTAAPLLLAIDFGVNVSANGTPFPISFLNGLFALSN
jgi:hypothetical protein